MNICFFPLGYGYGFNYMLHVKNKSFRKCLSFNNIFQYFEWLIFVLNRKIILLKKKIILNSIKYKTKALIFFNLFFHLIWRITVHRTVYQFQAKNALHVSYLEMKYIPLTCQHFFFFCIFIIRQRICFTNFYHFQ